MKCEKCEVSVFEKPLMRMNEKGVTGIFWCHDCARTHDPELFKNEMEDQTDVEKDLINICYGGLR